MTSTPKYLKRFLPLLSLYIYFSSKSFAIGEIPLNWRRANIYALFKKGKRTDPANHRPVSLTSQVSKLLERLVLPELLAFCNDYQIVSSPQHGFRSGCSCMTNLMDCFNDWTTSFDHIGTSIDIIYTDFKKAFNSVPYQRLEYKLTQYGITGNLHHWLTSFLTNRMQRTACGGKQSSWTQVTYIRSTSTHHNHDNRTNPLPGLC